MERDLRRKMYPLKPVASLPYPAIGLVLKDQKTEPFHSREFDPAVNFSGLYKALQVRGEERHFIADTPHVTGSVSDAQGEPDPCRLLVPVLQMSKARQLGRSPVMRGLDLPAWEAFSFVMNQVLSLGGNASCCGLRRARGSAKPQPQAG